MVHIPLYHDEWVYQRSHHRVQYLCTIFMYLRQCLWSQGTLKLPWQLWLLTKLIFHRENIFLQVYKELPCTVVQHAIPPQKVVDPFSMCLQWSLFLTNCESFNPLRQNFFLFKNTLLTRACGVKSPRIPFSHIMASSSFVISDMCSTSAPIPLLHIATETQIPLYHESLENVRLSCQKCRTSASLAFFSVAQSHHCYHQNCSIHSSQGQTFLNPLFRLQRG